MVRNSIVWSCPNFYRTGQITDQLIWTERAWSLIAVAHVTPHPEELSSDAVLPVPKRNIARCYLSLLFQYLNTI